MSLDQIIVLLDSQPRGLRRVWLRLRKRWAERGIPHIPAPTHPAPEWWPA